MLASASSTKFGIIKCIEDNNKIFLMRGKINSLLISPFGTGKTSQIIRINNVDIVTGNDVSFPGLIGTITRTGEFIVGSCFKAGGKLLIIDEAQKMSRETKNAMNSLLDPPHRYGRVLGYKMLKPYKRKCKYNWVRGSENEFEIGSKFSCIASSLRMVEDIDIEDAWNSRFIPIRMKITDDYMMNLLAGRNVFDINAIKFEHDFEFEEYMKFHEYYWSKYGSSKFKEYFERYPDKRGYLSRNYGDLVRLAAFASAADGRFRIYFNDTKVMFDKYWNIMMYNMLMSPLTTEEYTILNNIDKTEDELARILCLSQPNVSHYIQNLKRKGLLLDVVKDFETTKF